jgi:predicted CopG family antitoxin
MVKQTRVHRKDGSHLVLEVDVGNMSPSEARKIITQIMKERNTQ